MADRGDYREAVNAMADRTGVIIPVYVPPDQADAVDVVGETAWAFCRQVGDPSAVCLAADGPGPGADAVRAASAELGTGAVLLGENRGKLAAVRAGAAALLERNDLRYVAVADQDGDHFANELLNFVRAARHVEQVAQTERVLVIGSRTSRHRPLGFLRGELEELADRVLLDALQYDAAVTGRPLRLEFLSDQEEAPDFHSGYKLMTRATAESVLLGDPQPTGVDDDAYYRHAVEAVLVVEAVADGAVLAAVNRSTLDGQPLSVFGTFDRPRLIADKIIWPCKRLGVPGEFVRQWVRNHVQRLALRSLAPQGLNELEAVHRLAVAAWGLGAGDGPLRGRRFI